MENLNLNNLEINKEKEVEKIKTKILSSSELIKHIYQGKNLPQDSRFLSSDKGGTFKYFDLKELVDNQNQSNQKIFPIVEMNNEIIGLSELEQDPNNLTNFWLKFISIEPTHQGKNYSKKLIEEIINFTKENNYSLEISSYTKQGELKIKKNIEQIAKENNVQLF